MLKRSAVIVLTTLYLITASGFALNLHYCFNRLTSLSVDSPSKGCVKERETNSMKCCKEKHLVVKVKDAHESGSFSFESKNFVAEVPDFQFTNLQLTPIEKGCPATAYRGPPPSPDVTLYLKNCTFRI